MGRKGSTTQALNDTLGMFDKLRKTKIELNPMVRTNRSKTISTVNKFNVSGLQLPNTKSHELLKPVYKPICRDNFNAYLEKHHEIIEKAKTEQKETLAWLFL